MIILYDYCLLSKKSPLNDDGCPEEGEYRLSIDSGSSIDGAHETCMCC